MFGLGWPESGLGDARIFPVYSTGGYAWRAERYVNFLCILRVAMLGEAKYTAISCILRVAMLGEPASPGLLTVVVPGPRPKVVMPQRSKGVPLEATKSCLSK